MSILDTKKAVDESALLSDKYKQTAVIDDLIEYLQDKRAEGLKEAINLYHEEQHRSRIEEFAEEQLRLTNAELQCKLLETQESYLIECAHSDTIWACGKRLTEPDRLDASKWTGQNILGFSLMEVRRELRSLGG